MSGMWMAMLLVLVSIPGARAAVLTVCPDGSADFETVQAAILAASDGDVIELCDGTHPGGGEFFGKAVTVRSASGDPASCVLFAGFYIHEGEGNGTRIESLTIAWGYSGVGGGANCFETSPVFFNCVFERCFAKAGGAVASEGGHPRFERCVFRGNSASLAGGAAYHSGFVDYVDCDFVGNRAESMTGGAIRSESSAPMTLVGCTIAGNFAGSGGGISGVGGSFVAENCLIWGNCATNFGDQIQLSFGQTMTAECCLIDTTGVAGPGLTLVGENLFVDPLFCDPRHCGLAPTIEGDYRLAENSPALSVSCGPIGALGAGCAVISIRPVTWGSLKGRYRLPRP